MKPNQIYSPGKFTRSIEGWALLLALLVVGLLLGFLVMGGEHSSQVTLESPKSLFAAVSDLDAEHGSVADSHGNDGHDAHTSKFACPMMCIPPTDQPGRCPVCGMNLTEVATSEHGSDDALPQLHLSTEAVHLAEIRTVSVKRMAVANAIRLFGRIDFDSAHITRITAFMPGVIDRVYIKRAGQFVRWGDPLFDIYSSDLLETQRQLVEAMQYVPGFLAFQANTPHVAQDVPIQARKSRAAGSEHTPAQKEALQKIKALRHKLRILGLPKRDIDEFMKKGEATGIATVYAPMYGQITVQNATEGTFVNTGTSLFTIADPKYVWARLDVYESDYPWIRIGQRVTFITEAYPGEVFEARVGYIDPVFDPETRTFSIGAMTTQDQGGRLKTGMLVRAEAHAQLSVDGGIATHSRGTPPPPLVIPASAPLITGARALVYVAVPGDRPVFEGREVVLGPRAKDHYIVRDGLAEGERVVVNGNFKIDSAMQILAKPSLMSPSGGFGGAAHGHHGQPADTSRVQSEKVPMAAENIGEDQADKDHREHPLADGHQHPDLSKQMHDHYMEQRRTSRMAISQENRIMDHAEPSHPMTMGRVPGRSADGHLGSSSEDSPHGNRRVRRRKPGQYGDTTRQGASMLEEHRQRWRRKPVRTQP